VRRVFTIASLLLASMLAGLASASYVESGTCVSSARWTFSPPLAQVMRSGGTATLTHTVTCVYAGASTEPPGEFVTFAFGGGTAAYSYFGNCVQALLDTVDVTATLLSGTVLVLADSAPVPFASTFALVPDEPCNEASATGPGVITALLTR
jgi:hypothetical protein